MGGWGGLTVLDKSQTRLTICSYDPPHPMKLTQHLRTRAEDADDEVLNFEGKNPDEFFVAKEKYDARKERMSKRLEIFEHILLLVERIEALKEITKKLKDVQTDAKIIKTAGVLDLAGVMAINRTGWVHSLARDLEEKIERKKGVSKSNVKRAEKTIEEVMRDLNRAFRSFGLENVDSLDFNLDSLVLSFFIEQNGAVTDYFRIVVERAEKLGYMVDREAFLKLKPEEAIAALEDLNRQLLAIHEAAKDPYEVISDIKRKIDSVK